MPNYKVLAGINYPPNNQRAAVGSVVDDIPAGSIPWLLAQGIIIETTDPVNRIDDMAGQAVSFTPVQDAPAPATPDPATAPAAPAPDAPAHVEG